MANAIKLHCAAGRWRKPDPDRPQKVDFEGDQEDPGPPPGGGPESILVPKWGVPLKRRGSGYPQGVPKTPFWLGFRLQNPFWSRKRPREPGCVGEWRPRHPRARGMFTLRKGTSGAPKLTTSFAFQAPVPGPNSGLFTRILDPVTANLGDKLSLLYHCNRRKPRLNFLASQRYFSSLDQCSDI